MKKLKLFFACLLMAVLSIGQVWGEVWVKVTAAPTNWAGEYLLVYEPSSSNTVYVYTGVDGQNGVGSESATLDNGLLTKPDGATAILISARTGTNAGKYSIKILSGTNANKYIGKSNNANGIDFNDSEVNNEISYSTDQVTIKSAGGAYLRFNSNSNEMRFRYYKSSSYTNQQKIQLYKKCYTVTYNKNGGTSTMTDSNSPYAPNATVTVLDNAFTAPEGKTFDGWNSKADGSGDDFGASFTITKDTTLYAQWASASCTDKVNITKGTPESGASFNLSKTGEQNCCDALTINVTGITAPEGKRFLQITQSGIDEGDVTIDQANKTVTYAAGSSGDSEINVEFEEIPSHNINFNINGGSVTPAYVSVKEGETYSTLPSVTGLTNNCEYGTFVGWTSDANISGGAKPTMVTSVTMSTSDVTLKAVYSKTTPSAGPSGSKIINKDTENFPSGYETSNTFVEHTLEGINFKIQQGYVNGTKLQWRAAGNSNGTGTIYNTGTFPAKISSVVIVYDGDANKNFTLNVGNSENPTSGTEITPSADEDTYTFDCSGENADYFVLTNGTGAGYLASITINYGSAGTTTYSLDANCCTPYEITASGIGGELILAPNLTEACAGTEITLTANTPDGSHQGEGVIKVVKTADSENDITSTVYNSGTGVLTMPDYEITVTATYAEKSTPSVNADPAALDFGSPLQGAPVAAQTFSLTGSALEEGTLTLIAPSGYIVSPSEIAVSAGSLSATEITVTPNTETAGDKSGNITISGAGIASTNLVALTMNVQETYTVNWYVNGTKIDANSITDVVGTAVTAPSDFSAFTDCQDLTFVGWKEGSAIDGGYTTEAPSLAEVVTAIPAANKDYYAVFAEGTPGSAQWEKATSVAAGEYLIVYETDGVAFDGSLSTLDAVGNTKAVTINDSKIAYSSATEAAKFTIAAKTGGYSIKSASNLYIGQTSDANGLVTSETDDYVNTISISEGDADIVCSSAHLRYNDASNQTRFRYYKSASYSGQKAIQLYKKNVSPANFTKWYTTCPHCNSVTLSKAGESAGNTFALQRNSAEVSAVNTCEATSVNVVASPATGYELTNLVVSGVTGATYSNGVITIPQDAEGTLTVTATFVQKNYSVTMVKYPTDLEGVVMNANITDAHYGEEVTITTNEPAGYIFSGWGIYDETDVNHETDIASQFFTGAYADYEYAKTAKFVMQDKNIFAEANFKKVYTVDEFMNTEFTKTNNRWYYVTGLVAEVPASLYDNKKMTYVISDDATKDGLYLTLYRGLGEDGADFSDVSDLAVGDRVIIYGQWSTTYKNMNDGNYIIEDGLTKKALSVLTIVGDASITTYDVGDSFNKAGLSLTATYNTGYVVANYTGTTITSNFDAPTTFTAGITSVTVSAEEGLISTSRDINVTVSSAVLDHVELAAGVQTEFWAKEQYKEPLLDAYLNDMPATVLSNVTGVSNTTGLDMSVAGDKSVNITYTRKAGQSADVQYDFTVKAVVVDEDHAHSVATAREIIDKDKTEGENLELADNDTKTHVIGVVTSVTALNGDDEGKYTIVIKDQADAAKVMTLYKVTLKSGISSVAEEDLIKAYGNLYYHSGSSKYEINTGGEVVWKQPKVSITIANQTMEIGQTLTIADVATLDPSAAPVNYDIVANEDNCITLSEGVITAVAQGTATVSISAEAYDGYLANSKTFTVTVKPAAVHTNVVLYAEYDGAYYALNNEGKATPINICDGKVVVADETTKNKILWDRAEREGVATFYNVTAAKYLNGSNSTTLGVLASEGTYTSWTWKEAGYYTSNTGTQTVRTFLYRKSAANGFMNYAQSNKNTDDYADYTVIYTGEVVIGEFATVRPSLTVDKYYTICLDKKVIASEGASFWNMSKRGTDIAYIEEHTGELTAGTPYIFQAEAEELKVVYEGAAVGTPVANGALRGTFATMDQYALNTAKANNANSDIYLLSNNSLVRVTGANTDNNSLAANRAYIVYNALEEGTPSYAPGKRVRAVPMQGQTATDIDEFNVSETPVKMIIDGQLYILRGEKMYDATGKLVK